MLAPAATMASPYELQAKAKAVSASAKIMPPWQVRWPLSMSLSHLHRQADLSRRDIQHFDSERLRGEVACV